jgi:hypothetical protein
MSAHRCHPDLLDAQDRQLLAMAMFSAIVLSPLLLEDDDLSAARLLDDPRAHRRVRQGWAPNCSRISITNCQHMAKRDFGPDIAFEPFDHDLVARSDPVLFSTSLYDCKHAGSEFPK